MLKYRGTITATRYYNLKPNEIVEAFSAKTGSDSMIGVSNMTTLAWLLGLPTPDTAFLYERKSLRSLKDFWKREIEIYCASASGHIYPIHKTCQSRYENTIQLLLNEHPDPGAEITNMKLISNPDTIPTVYRCEVTPGCQFTTDKIHNFKRHTEVCADISQQKIQTVGKVLLLPYKL